MNYLTAPIKKSNVGTAVAKLQDCLLFLLEKAPAIVPDAERPSLLGGRRRERAGQTYGEFTSRTVFLFQQTQKQPPLRATRDVDEPTAAALNMMIIRLADLLLLAAVADFGREAVRLDNHNEWIQAEREFRFCRSRRAALRETQTLALQQRGRFHCLNVLL